MENVSRSRNTFWLLFFLALIVGVLAGLKLIAGSQVNNQPQVVFNHQVIFVEIVNTPEKIAQGLSGRTILKSNSGMLFIFNKPGRYSFWMKDMKFPLDFVFIKNAQVVDIAENILPPQEGESPKTVNAQQDFDKVLEINQGMVKKLNVKKGDVVEYKL